MVPGMQYVSGHLLALSSTNARSGDGESNGSMLLRGLGRLFSSLPFKRVEARAGLAMALGTDAAGIPGQAHQLGGV